MALRRQFLEQLFKQLNTQDIPYCVLRNYTSVYEESLSDVDVLVDPQYLQTVDEALHETMRHVGADLFRRADFMCRGYIFSVGREMLHIDIEYCKRWWLLDVIPAADLLEGRRPFGEFFVPSPEKESIVLWTQAIWAKQLTPRYRARLAELYPACDESTLRRGYRKAYGTLGDRLLKAHANIQDEPCPPSFFSHLRAAIVRRTLLTPSSLLKTFTYCLGDLARLHSRLTSMAGLLCQVVSPKGIFDGMELLLKNMQAPYPLGKCEVREIDSTAPRSLTQRVRTRVADLQRIFRGGATLEHYLADSDIEITAVVQQLRSKRKWLNYPRVIVCYRHEKPGFVIYGDNGLIEEVSRREDVLLSVVNMIVKRVSPGLSSH